MKKFLAIILMLTGCMMETESSDSVSEPALHSEIFDDYHPPGRIPVKRFKCDDDLDCPSGYYCDKRHCSVIIP